MITPILLSILLPLSSFAAGEVDLTPDWKGKPFLVAPSSEENLAPEQRIGLIGLRAAQICAYFKAPAGKFRSYTAVGVRTNRISPLGADVAWLEKRSGGYSVKALRLPAEDRSEVLRQVRCRGNP